MKYLFTSATLVAALFCYFSGSAYAQVTLTTVPEWIAGGNQSIGSLVAGTTTGETFVDPAGANDLTSFTFYLQGTTGSQIDFQGEVFNWFGNLNPSGGPPFGPQGTVGPALYTSSTISYTADGNWDAVTITIPGAGVALTTGNAYVIDLTATGGTGSAVFGNTWLYLFGGLGAPTQGGVNFSGPGGSQYGPWTEPGFGFYGDLAFTANFSSPVPEPSTFISGALLLLPFGAGAFRLARKSLGK